MIIDPDEIVWARDKGTKTIRYVGPNEATFTVAHFHSYLQWQVVVAEWENRKTPKTAFMLATGWMIYHRRGVRLAYGLRDAAYYAPRYLRPQWRVTCAACYGEGEFPWKPFAGATEIATSCAACDGTGHQASPLQRRLRRRADAAVDAVFRLVDRVLR